MKVRYWQMNGDVDDVEPWPSDRGPDGVSGLVLTLPEGADFTPFNALDAFCKAFDDDASNYRILWSKPMMRGDWLIICSDYDKTKVPDSGPWEYLLIAVREDE